MNDFEMVFRGAVHRYLKQNGHDVHRVIGVVPDTESLEVVVLYEDSEETIRHQVFHGYFDEFIGVL